ncbi:unnamed protein product [Pylaiella littoralis]
MIKQRSTNTAVVYSARFRATRLSSKQKPPVLQHLLLAEYPHTSFFPSSRIHGSCTMHDEQKHEGVAGAGAAKQQQQQQRLYQRHRGRAATCLCGNASHGDRPPSFCSQDTPATAKDSTPAEPQHQQSGKKGWSGMVSRPKRVKPILAHAPTRGATAPKTTPPIAAVSVTMT